MMLTTMHFHLLDPFLVFSRFMFDAFHALLHVYSLSRHALVGANAQSEFRPFCAIQTGDSRVDEAAPLSPGFEKVAWRNGTKI